MDEIQSIPFEYDDVVEYAGIGLSDVEGTRDAIVKITIKQETQNQPIFTGHPSSKIGTFYYALTNIV